MWVVIAVKSDVEIANKKDRLLLLGESIQHSQAPINQFAQFAYAKGPPVKGGPPVVSCRVASVLTDFKKLSIPIVRELAIKLSDSYPANLDRNVFADEMVQLVQYAKDNACESPGDIAKLLHAEQLQDTFPNAYVALRIYLSLMVSNCSGESSFSKMALIKNKLRSTMSDERLSALELFEYGE